LLTILCRGFLLCKGQKTLAEKNRLLFASILFVCTFCSAQKKKAEHCGGQVYLLCHGFLPLAKQRMQKSRPLCGANHFSSSYIHLPEHSFGCNPGTKQSATIQRRGAQRPASVLPRQTATRTALVRECKINAIISSIEKKTAFVENFQNFSLKIF
jgi:hypothetical protein